jgi:hypothetical protein
MLDLFLYENYLAYKNYRVYLFSGDWFPVFCREWSLQDVKKPIGLSEYKFSKILPANLESALPSIETLERKLASFDGTA